MSLNIEDDYSSEPHENSPMSECDYASAQGSPMIPGRIYQRNSHGPYRPHQYYNHQARPRDVVYYDARGTPCSEAASIESLATNLSRCGIHGGGGNPRYDFGDASRAMLPPPLMAGRPCDSGSAYQSRSAPEMISRDRSGAGMPRCRVSRSDYEPSDEDRLGPYDPHGQLSGRSRSKYPYTERETRAFLGAISAQEEEMYGFMNKYHQPEYPPASALDFGGTGGGGGRRSGPNNGYHGNSAVARVSPSGTVMSASAMNAFLHHSNYNMNKNTYRPCLGSATVPNGIELTSSKEPKDRGVMLRVEPCPRSKIGRFRPFGSQVPLLTGAMTNSLGSEGRRTSWNTLSHDEKLHYVLHAKADTRKTY